jgi:hypothetical protein
MHTGRIFVISVVGLALMAGGVAAQPSTLANGQVLPLRLRATCRSVNSNGTLLVNTELSEADVIAAALGSNTIASVRSPLAGTNLFSEGFALVYNPARNGIQVVNTNNGTVVSDVLEFTDAGSTSDSRGQTRLDFLSLPGQTNMIGSAVLNQVAAGSTPSQTNELFLGNLQWYLTGNQVLGAPVPPTNNAALNSTTGGNPPANNGLLPGGAAAPIPGFGVGTGLTNPASVTNGFGSSSVVAGSLEQTNTRVCLGFVFGSGPPLFVAAAGLSSTVPHRPPLAPTGGNPLPGFPGGPALSAPPPRGTVPPPSPALPGTNGGTPGFPGPTGNATNGPGT